MFPIQKLLLFVFAMDGEPLHPLSQGRWTPGANRRCGRLGNREIPMNKGIRMATASVVALSFASAIPVNAAEMLTAVGPGEGAVDIVAWAGYIDRGDSDKA